MALLVHYLPLDEALCAAPPPPPCAAVPSLSRCVVGGSDDEFELPTAHCEDRKGPKEGVDARAADGYATATYVQDERQM